MPNYGVATYGLSVYGDEEISVDDTFPDYPYNDTTATIIKAEHFNQIIQYMVDNFFISGAKGPDGPAGQSVITLSKFASVPPTAQVGTVIIREST